MHELNTAIESFGVGEEALVVFLLRQTYRDSKEKTVITFSREFPKRIHSSSKFFFFCHSYNTRGGGIRPQVPKDQ